MTRQHGFTLLEMLAAIALLVVASAVLFGAFAQSSRSLVQVVRSDRHTAAARSLMDEFDLGPLAVGQQRGNWQGIDWVMNITLEQVAASRFELFRLDLTLSDHGHASHYSTLRTRMAGASQ